MSKSIVREWIKTLLKKEKEGLGFILSLNFHLPKKKNVKIHLPKKGKEREINFLSF